MDRRDFMRFAALGALTLAGSAPGCADDDDATGDLPAARLQAALDEAVSDAGVPGLTLGIETPRGSFYGAAGKADLAAGQPMTADTQIRLASATKTMTSALVLKHCELGLLRLDDTLAARLPEAVGAVPNASAITIGHILNHTAGLWDHESDPGLDLLSASGFGKDWTPAEILAFLTAHGPYASPGEQWFYSNTGYYLLGLTLEAVTGSTVDALAARHLFGPLGMRSTSLTRRGTLAPPCTGGYCLLPDNVTYRNMLDWNMSWDWTAGSGASVARDMIVWAKGLFGGAVVSPATLALMTTPRGAAANLAPGIGYGYGVNVFENDSDFGEPSYGHDGANGGTHVYWKHLPKSGRTVFGGMNRFDYGDEGLDAISAMRAVMTKVARLTA